MGRPRLVVAGALALVAAPALAQDDDAAIAALLAGTTPEAAIAEARALTAEGDLDSAAATLERALLADPNAHDARLLYAATLCRLGDAQGARVEIGKLDRQAISEAMWAEANTACGGTLRRPLPAETDTGAGISGDAYVGLAYDSDAAGAIVLQVDFLGASERDDGWAMVGGARLNWRSEGFAGDGGLYAGVSIASKHNISGPEQDYDIGEARIGYGRSSGATGWSLGPVVRHLRLFGDPYVTEYGGQAELIFNNASSRKVRLRAEGVFQDYQDGFPGNSGDGARFDLSLAYEARIREKGYATIGIAGEFKTADEKSLGYAGGRLFGALYWPFESRDYIALSGTLRYIDFREDDDFGFDRKDTRAFVRGAYGLALNRTNLFVEGAVSYTIRDLDTDGGLDFRTYRSAGGEVRLIWRF